MKILHVSDTHLGYSAYKKISDQGINQRELDNYNSFKQFINYAIKTKPDIIIHSGDLFDSVRPNNRAITFSINQMLRLLKSKIPFIVISGNHEQPKLTETGHIFSIFEHIKNVYPIYNLEYEKNTFIIKNKKISIHSIPQTISKDEFIKNLNKINIDNSSDFNILVLHGSVKGIQDFSMNEFNELIIPKNFLKNEFDYIALGHYHKYTKISDNCQYAGSTEHLSFSESIDKKGFIEINLDDENLKTKFIEIKNRPFLDLEPIMCDNKNTNEIMEIIELNIKKINPKNKVIRVKLENIPLTQYRGIDFEKIKKLCKNATHYEMKANIITNINSKKMDNKRIDSIAKEYNFFIKDQLFKDKKIFLDLGLEYIERIESEKRRNDT